MENITRRDFIKLAIISVGGSIALKTRIKRDHNEVSRHIGEEVILGVGNAYKLPASVIDIRYSRMIENQKLLLTREINSYTSPLYFPSNIGQIIVDGHQFSVASVTPKKISLKYLDYKHSDIFGL